jgi:hypothetical protein
MPSNTKVQCQGKACDGFATGRLGWSIKLGRESTIQTCQVREMAWQERDEGVKPAHRYPAFYCLCTCLPYEVRYTRYLTWHLHLAEKPYPCIGANRCQAGIITLLGARSTPRCLTDEEHKLKPSSLEPDTEPRWRTERASSHGLPYPGLP